MYRFVVIILNYFKQLMTAPQGQCAIADIDDATQHAIASPPPAAQVAPQAFADLGYMAGGNPPPHGVAPAAGQGNPVAERAHNLTTPQMVRFFLDKPPIRLITTGGNHALALLEDGSLYAWVWTVSVRAKSFP